MYWSTLDLLFLLNIMMYSSHTRSRKKVRARRLTCSDSLQRNLPNEMNYRRFHQKVP
jgi:hypothetical protein